MIRSNIGRNSLNDYNLYRRKRAKESLAYLKKFTYLKEKKILDIGCGHGSNAFTMAKEGGNVIAIDLDEKRLELAREINFHENITYSNINLEKLLEHKFHIVTLLDVLEHVGNYEKVISDLIPLIDKNSTIFIEYNPYYSFIGHHLYDFTLIPVQLLPYKITKKIVLRNANYGGIFSAKESLKQFRELNKITCRNLRKVLKKNNLNIIFERNHIAIPNKISLNTSIFRHIPILEDLFSASHILILKLNE